MDGRSDDLSDRVGTIESTLDDLRTSVDRRFDAVDRRFDAVDRRFDAVDRRFDAVEQRFVAVDAAFVEQRQYTEFAYAKLEERMNAGFGRLERKLDQFIDTQLTTNELVDRRLRALEDRV